MNPLIGVNSSTNLSASNLDDVIKNDAILPDSAVICPDELRINNPLDELTVVAFIPKPPIVPNVALIPPCRYTLFVANP